MTHRVTGPNLATGIGTAVGALGETVPLPVTVATGVGTATAAVGVKHLILPQAVLQPTGIGTSSGAVRQTHRLTAPILATGRQ